MSAGRFSNTGGTHYNGAAVAPRAARTNCHCGTPSCGSATPGRHGGEAPRPPGRTFPAPSRRLDDGGGGVRRFSNLTPHQQRENTGGRQPYDYKDARCPIDWPINMFRPVLTGIMDIGVADKAPAPMKVLYPSIQSYGGPYGRPIADCGPYPMVVFAHGYCEGDEDWTISLQALARSGYVVAVPFIKEINGGDVGSADATLYDVWLWMLSKWKFRHLIESRVGFAGHSYGAAAVANLIAKTGLGQAYALIAGDFGNAEPTLLDYASLTKPTLIIKGGQDIVNAGDWNSIPASSRHLVTFQAGAHNQFLPTGYNCSTQAVFSSADCEEIWSVTRDVLVTFFSKYIPRPNQFPIPDSLLPPTTAALLSSNPTHVQKYFIEANKHMSGLEAFLAGATDCTVTLESVTPSSGQGYVAFN